MDRIHRRGISWRVHPEYIYIAVVRTEPSSNLAQNQQYNFQRTIPEQWLGDVGKPVTELGKVLT